MDLLRMNYAVEAAVAGSINKADKVFPAAQPDSSRVIGETVTAPGASGSSRTSEGTALTSEGERLIVCANRINDS